MEFRSLLGEHRHERLGQQHDVVSGVFGRRLGDDFAMLGSVFDGRVHAGGAEQVIGHGLRRGALAGGEDRLAFQVGEGVHGVAALQDIQHAQRVHGQRLHAAIGFLIERGNGVGRQRRHIQFAGDELADHNVRRAGEGEVISVGRRARFVVGHQLGCAHAGRPLQKGDVDGRLFRLRAAEQQRQRKHQHEKQSDFLFHFIKPPIDLLFEKRFPSGGKRALPG